MSHATQKSAEILQDALNQERLPESLATSLKEWLEASYLPKWMHESIAFLIQREQWEALQERFGTRLHFGTGGMRGRSLARVPTPMEYGMQAESPEWAQLHSPADAKDSLPIWRKVQPMHPGVGSSLLNDVTVSLATLGLWNNVRERFPEEPLKLAVAYDTRFFSKRFADQVKFIWEAQGGRVFAFDKPRSTPQLSFALRHHRAHAGVMITASHNPPHDNGYKVYLEDGAQVIPPYADALIRSIEGLSLERIAPFMKRSHASPSPKAAPLGHSNKAHSKEPDAPDGSHSKAQDQSKALAQSELDLDQDDTLYWKNFVEQTLLFPGRIKSQRPRIVFSALHGTGAAATLPVLSRLGVDVLPVRDQCEPDPCFSSVESPNPENPSAFKKGIELATQHQAMAVLATDPDADRIGLFIRDGNAFVRLSGNQIACILSAYRIEQLKAAGLIRNPERCALIKSLVTTGLLKSIAAEHGLRCVETLTGFKWIGAKMLRYERDLRESGIDPDALASFAQRCLAYQEKSTLFVFGAEESFGYLCGERVRDKDGNAAAVLICEWLASLMEQGKTPMQYLESLYRRYGYAQENLMNLYYEGPQGAEMIQAIVHAFRNETPKRIGAYTVTQFEDFDQEGHHDAEGFPLPRENFLRFSLEKGLSFALRASGTEPKLKLYLFIEKALRPDQSLADVQADSQALLTQFESDLNELIKAYTP